MAYVALPWENDWMRTELKLELRSLDIQPSACFMKPHVHHVCDPPSRWTHGLSPPRALLAEEMGSLILGGCLLLFQKERFRSLL